LSTKKADDPYADVRALPAQTEAPNVFEGYHSESMLPGLRCMRSDSVEVTNDPRIFLDNILARRLSAFSSIVVAAILVGSVSCSCLLTIEDDNKDNWVKYAGLVGMVTVFLLNLFCVLVITQQYYQVFRLMTAGPMGFEIAKSYYLNVNIATMRHMATQSFFRSIPIFTFSIGCMIFEKLGRKWIMSLPLFILLGAMAFTLHMINRKHANIFMEKYTITKAHERPLQMHISNIRHEVHQTGSV